MKQSIVKEKLRGKAGFEQFYAEHFASRWQSLAAALKLPSKPIAWQTAASPYFMDRASIIAALSLPSGGKRILDMCAAPGGKSLVLSSRMDSTGHLVCNERSKSRVVRLKHTLDDCLEKDVRARVSITCTDGALMCRAGRGWEERCFDRILLDAPCSSERHVMADEKYLSQWSPSRIKTLSVTQWALLSSAWRMLEGGGYLLYSTCALCCEENDEIIKRLLHKARDAEVQDVKHFEDEPFMDGITKLMERTQYGWQILPDRACGMGPIYFALIRKGQIA